MSTTEKPAEPLPPQIIMIEGKPVEIPGPNPNCNSMEFKRLAIVTHDAAQRKSTALRWLKKHGPDCRDYDLNIIENNLANWLGSANGIEITSLIYTLFYYTKRPANPIGVVNEQAD